MASVQACGSAEAYHAEYKTVVTQMTTEAHNVVNKHRLTQGAATGGCIKNNASGKCIKLLTRHEWAGHNKTPYPHSIAKGHSGIFAHAAKSRCESNEAAVVYSDECGAGWLVAWSVKEDLSECNQVYVETGPVDNYSCVDWDVIKEKLDESSETGYYVDEDNGNEAFAKITSGHKAALVASFNSYSD